MSWSSGVDIDNPLVIDDTYNQSDMQVNQNDREPNAWCVAMRDDDAAAHSNPLARA